MKGQQRIVSEVLIFAIGIGIASFVALSFQTLTDSLSRTSVEDHLTSIANVVRSGMIKAAGTDSIIRLRIPRDVSDMIYKVSVQDDTITIRTMEKGFFVSEKIFNIDHPYIISGEVFSSAEYININSRGSNIILNKSGF